MPFACNCRERQRQRATRIKVLRSEPSLQPNRGTKRVIVAKLDKAGGQLGSGAGRAAPSPPAPQVDIPPTPAHPAEAVLEPTTIQQASPQNSSIKNESPSDIAAPDIGLDKETPDRELVWITPRRIVTRSASKVQNGPSREIVKSQKGVERADNSPVIRAGKATNPRIAKAEHLKKAAIKKLTGKESRKHAHQEESESIKGSDETEGSSNSVSAIDTLSAPVLGGDEESRDAQSLFDEDAPQYVIRNGSSEERPLKITLLRVSTTPGPSSLSPRIRALAAPAEEPAVIDTKESTPRFNPYITPNTYSIHKPN